MRNLYTMTCPVKVNEEGQCLPDSCETDIYEKICEEGKQNEPVEVKVKRAIDSPYYKYMRNSPCQPQLEKALACWFNSTAKWKGTDCYHLQMTVRNCVLSHLKDYPENIVECQFEGIEFF